MQHHHASGSFTVAIEHVTGTLHGRAGSFVLQHTHAFGDALP